MPARSRKTRATRDPVRSPSQQRTSRTRPLSELECFTIGLVWQIGPCSPYELRRHMLASPSSQWSGSAGAMYPLMRRLEALGLLKSSSARTGKRERREYGITRAGTAALRTWVGPPMPPEAISVAYDPLRSRARFLGVLTENQRLAWLKAAEHALAEVAASVLRWQEPLAVNDRFMNLTTRHEQIETEARHRWLQELRADLIG